MAVLLAMASSAIAHTQSTVTEELICPITGEVPEDPVMLQVDGRVYSKAALEKWFTRSMTSPHTRQSCTRTDMIESPALRNMCALAKREPQAQATAPIAPEPSKYRINDTGTIAVHPSAHRDGKLIMTIACDATHGVATAPSDLAWSDLWVCIDNSYSTSSLVEGRSQDGSAEESAYCINDLLRHTSKAVATSLKGTGSRIGISTFDDSVETMADLTAVTSANCEELHASIDRIRPHGGTNIWLGCRHGVKHLMTRSDKSRNPAILLLTDGQPNQGANKPENEAIAGLFTQPPSNWDCEPCGPIPVYSIGFGYALKQNLMYNIARDTGGVNSSIPGAEMMVTVFSNAIANILNTRCYATVLHLVLPNPDEWQIGTAGVREHLVDCNLPVTFSSHEDGSLEIQVLIGSLQFKQERSIAVNLEPISPDASICYWASYWQGGEMQCTASGNIDNLGLLTNSGSPNIDYELLRTYACLQLRRMIEDHARGLESGCGHRYQNFLGRIRELDEPSRSSNALRCLETTWTDQVRLGVVSQAPEHRNYWSRWGWIYADQLLSALSNQCSTNFKDDALQPFVGALVAATSDRVSEVFDDLPNTLPTGLTYGSRCQTQRPATQTVYRASDWNQSSSGTVCFTGDTLVSLRPTGSSNTISAPISTVVPGDQVLGGVFDKTGTLASSDYYVVTCVVETLCPSGQTELVEVLPGCKATPWHPISRGSSPWTAACSIAAPTISACPSVFSLALEQGAMMKLVASTPAHPSLQPCYGASLGHENPAPGLAHPFWGTGKVMEALQKLPGYPRVKLTPKMIRRDGAPMLWGREVSDIC